MAYGKFLVAVALTIPVAAQGAPVKVKPAGPPLLLKVAPSVKTGKVTVTLPPPDRRGVIARYIYVSQVESGLGSASIVLDKGVSTPSRLLTFRRVGNKVVAEVENSHFVASAGSDEERESVRSAFATSILWVGKIDKELPGGGVTIDLAPFLLRDDLKIARALKEGDGDYRLVPDLSAVDPSATRVFPTNAEFSAQLTFRADEPKAETLNLTPDPGTVSLIVRHSLVALPTAGFTVRHDPFGYTFGRQVVDASVPLGQTMVRDLMNRFRLEKTDPGAARSTVRKPIVFYIDRAAPAAIRAALVEGVGWWRDAFDKAGLVDAFRAEVLPEGADPLDARYNVVNWINRATRGWSYGGPSIEDPRTGEIIKGTVQLGSLRVRQDVLIFQALVGAGLTGTGAPGDPITVALARIRQLGAHEVGHALGFEHNFAASSQDRYSVMDYPAPRVTLDLGKISLADAYGEGTGRWDRFLVAYAYGAHNDAAAAPVLAQARNEGLRFVSDNDSRPNDTAQPWGAIWDDHQDPTAELARVMQVRRAALDRFDADALSANSPQSELRRAFVPIWLIHRYQVEAAAKLLGGVEFPYALAGERGAARTVPGARQSAALDALLDTLTPASLAVPDRLLPLLSVSTNRSPDRQTLIEILPTAGGPVFDPLRATESAAVQTLNALLAPTRLNRLEIQHAADSSVPSPSGVIDRLIQQTVGGANGRLAIERRIAVVTTLALARAARAPALSPALALALNARIERLAHQLERAGGPSDQSDWAHGLAMLLRDREALHAAISDPQRLPVIPPGMPIG